MARSVRTIPQRGCVTIRTLESGTSSTMRRERRISSRSGRSVGAVATNAAGDRVAIATGEGVTLVDGATGVRRGEVALPGLTMLQFSPGDRELIGHTNEPSLYRIPLRGAEEERAAPTAGSDIRPARLGGHYRAIGAARSFPVPVGTYGGTIASLSEDGAVVSRTIAAHHGPVTGVAGLQDGTWVSVGALTSL